MSRIFIYELRRQVINKFFIGLLFTCMFFGWMTMRLVVIRGIANTAPFSSWSFGYYISLVMPLFITALLFCVWNIISPAARQSEVLFFATPVDKRVFVLVKCAAAVMSCLLVMIGIIMLGLGFLIH